MRLIPLVLGLVFIAAAVAINVQQRDLQREDVRGVTALRAELDSVRSELARAPSDADSARLTKSIADRTYFLGRREFHIPTRQESIDGWWGITGQGTVLASVGVLFVVLGAVAARSGRSA